jgi:broad specificity phosphatase PhoE
MTMFYFARHGKSQANQENAIADDASPLTKEGEAQARKLGRELKKADIAVIVTSPLQRARKTAEIIAKQLKVPEVIIIDNLRERGLGELEGRPKDQPNDWYYTVDGQLDVEPRGIVIARAEAALRQIKKLSERGSVLVVGHAVSGYYLREVAAGKRRFEDFDPPKQVPNGTYIKVEIAQPTPQRNPWVAVVGLVAMALIVVILAVATSQPTAPPQEVKQREIPLSPSDYQDDPNLQGAIQRQLQDQEASPQGTGGAQSPQEPAPTPLQSGTQTLQP